MLLINANEIAALKGARNDIFGVVPDGYKTSSSFKRANIFNFRTCTLDNLE